MDVRVRVGRAVRRHRMALGISQEELAHRCDIDRTYVSGIERGVRNPTVVILEKLGAVLHVPATVFLESDQGDGSLPSDD